MRSHLARAKRFLRASLLALLVLGLMIRPVLSGLSEMHAADHAMAIGEHADGHPHPEDHAPPSQADDGTPMEDHTSGTHGLMHQPGGHNTLELVAEIRIPSAPRAVENPPDLARSGLPLQPPSTPFRPPIA
ncbi:hypothetical protein [Lysobacter hankyongensis]|uniref:DUF2946 domain-containing protein n=1 Tax=Lysobacter hankyongensis TaxID=1176535 RepID=A0ABP9BR25_9GAMM